MIYALGDIHGTLERFNWMVQHVKPEDTIIQVGDFGFYKSVLENWDMYFPNGYPCRVLAIEGNHEDYRILNTFSKTELTEVRKNLFYVPRGHVMEVEGRLTAFMGGADSIDKAWRPKGVDWFPEEQISLEDMERLYTNLVGASPDILISHAPPRHVVQANWPPLNHQTWMLEESWTDVSSARMEMIHNKVQPTMHLCGHMHRSVKYGTVRILNIDETIVV